ncbi:MAG TPA: hypothetical protein VI248_04110 [Kineosporiaceae bacterium]
MKKRSGVHLGVRGKVIPVLISIGALLVAAGTLGSVTSPAHAQSGRRICTYTSPQVVGNPEGRKVALVLDYKKDGRCPYIDYQRVALPKEIAEWSPNANVYYPQPAPKERCEDWDRLMQLPSAGDDSVDSCNLMLDDHLYAVMQGPFTWHRALHEAYRDLGHYSNFE